MVGSRQRIILLKSLQRNRKAWPIGERSMGYSRLSSSSAQTKTLLRKEILQLQRELEVQKAIRVALEKALNGQRNNNNFLDDHSAAAAAAAEDLINEIERLEVEVMLLEKHVMSRKMIPYVGVEEEDSDKAVIDSDAYGSHSHNLGASFRASLGVADPFHSLPLSMLERMNTFSGSHADQTPNGISEEMIRCISAVYYQLSDTPFPRNDRQQMHFYPMVEIRGLLNRHSKMIDSLLHHYRSLISKLIRVDPKRLKHEEKLAFWINVHNSLVMHGFLVYGIPRGHLKRTSVALKAAYNIGGVTVSVETIQNSILRCRMSRPTKWLHMLLFPKRAMFKTGGIPIKPYGIKHPEPRLRFALSSGCRSDPPIRQYTAKKVMEELEMAKEEYIQMNVKVHREGRVLVPRNVEHFAKESEVYRHNAAAMAEEIFLALPSSWRKGKADDDDDDDRGRLWKRIDWMPHDFSFCVLLSNELASGGLWPVKNYKWAEPFQFV